MSGETTERRDQVLITFLLLELTAMLTFFINDGSMKGPFLIDRAIPFPYLRRLIMKRLVFLFFRVFLPLVGTPHGVTGCRPPLVRPSPPPCG